MHRVNIYVKDDAWPIVLKLKKLAAKEKRPFSQLAVWAFEEYTTAHKEGDVTPRVRTNAA
jgi:hypothetical protein